MYKIVTPVSHLFFNKDNAAKIAKHSDCLEIRERTLNLSFKKEKFFHCDEDLTLPWSKEFKSQLKEILKKKKKFKVYYFSSNKMLCEC